MSTVASGHHILERTEKKLVQREIAATSYRCVFDERRAFPIHRSPAAPCSITDSNNFVHTPISQLRETIWSAEPITVRNGALFELEGRLAVVDGDAEGNRRGLVRRLSYGDAYRCLRDFGMELLQKI